MALVFIKSQSASDTAGLSFVHGTSSVVFDSTYKELHARINKIHKELSEEIDMSQKRVMCEIKTLASNLDGRIGVFEKYRYIIIGGAIIIGLSMPSILNILKIVR